MQGQGFVEVQSGACCVCNYGETWLSYTIFDMLISVSLTSVLQKRQPGCGGGNLECLPVISKSFCDLQTN